MFAYFFKPIFNFGVPKSILPNKKRFIILTNQITVFYLLSCIPYFFIFYFLNLSAAFFYTIFVPFSYLIVFLLHKLKLFLISRFYLIIINSLIFSFFSCLLGKASGAHLLLFPLFCFVFILFRKTNLMMQILAFSIPFFAHYLLEISHFQLFFTELISPMHQKLLNYFAIFTSYSMIGFTLYSFSIDNLLAEKKLNIAINRAKERKIMLEKASQQVAYATLTRGIAHEIGNPMAMILSSIELLEENLDDAIKAKNYIATTKASILRLKSITSTMLQYGKPTSHSKSYVDINTLIHDADTLCQAECKKRHIMLIKKLDPTLPKINLDVNSMSQVFLNIILNSIEAIEKSGSITISSSLEDNQSQIKISFLDTGKGIPKKILTKIFDPFYTSKPTKTGLGLPMVLKTIDDHGGSISVQSSIKNYTLLDILLPITDPS
tara:strand:- start:307 stop:1611 length:1305 start_codon:yes stop_codon:yes gene_type:complete